MIKSQPTKWSSILVLLLTLALTGCRETILHELEESEANQAKVVLAEHGISTEKKKEGAGWSLSVDAESVNQALQLLDESRVVRRTVKGGADQSKSLVPGKEEREYYRERQLANNLEQTLERFPGIVEARVHLHLASLDRLKISAQDEAQSASVLLVSEADAVISEAKVKDLIAGASGVQIATVSVIVAPRPKKEAISQVKQENVAPVSTSQPVEIAKNVPAKAPSQLRLVLIGSGALLCSLVIMWLLFGRGSKKPNPQTKSNNQAQQNNQATLQDAQASNVANNGANNRPGTVNVYSDQVAGVY